MPMIQVSICPIPPEFIASASSLYNNKYLVKINVFSCCSVSHWATGLHDCACFDTVQARMPGSSPFSCVNVGTVAANALRLCIHGSFFLGSSSQQFKHAAGACVGILVLIVTDLHVSSCNTTPTWPQLAFFRLYPNFVVKTAAFHVLPPMPPLS